MSKTETKESKRHMLKKVYKQIERADSRRSVREWNEILGDI